ncbi:hypothetical protein [Bacillus sp. FJAT-44742]|uniref:hypothetical protein n=1 Tax=Bacillus sp. FJAT-44742 TaxID=2014005 RepID=UPI000C23A8A6|nr:hypothetical protein [Bacillus sp. FJAT-44742]
MAVVKRYTNKPNLDLKEKGEEFKVWTALSKDHDDYTIYVNEKDLIEKDSGTYVVAGANISGI